jgi:DNA-binding PadR family transcriptional regulator
MSPVFAHGHLRLYLLVLLADHPMHGYEVITALGDRFGGTYVPSAGTVYPRLAKLQEDGLITGTSDGRKTVYAITDAGRAELDARADEVALLENGVTDSVKSLADGVRASVGAEPGGSDGSADGGPTAVPAAGVRSLRDAEMAVAVFRQQLRADLRRRAARGTLDDAAVQRLRDGLEALRKSL